MTATRDILSQVKYEQRVEDGVLFFHITFAPDSISSFVYYLLYQDKIVLRSKETISREVLFHLSDPGIYKVKYYGRINGEKISSFAEPIVLSEKVGESLYISSNQDSDEETVISNLFLYSNSSHFFSYSIEESQILFGIFEGSYFKDWNYRDELFEFLNGNIEGMDISVPFNWDFTAFTDRRVAYRMHAFLRPACLLTEYWKTGESAYRDLFFTYVLDWIDRHPHYDAKDEWAWHDDTTARRTFIFCVALFLFEKLLTGEQTKIIKDSLRLHALLLTKENFYKFRHNHGMYQDRALAIYGMTFSEDSSYHLLLAKERAREYFRFAFTADGIHKEHSPMYHMDMAGSIRWFALAYQGVDSSFSEEMYALLDKMSDYVSWITMPDGQIPSIGDSKKRKRVQNLWIENPIYRYVNTGGADGRAPTGTIKVFQNAGYGIIRKDWNMDGQGTWMMLLAATHSIAHKHHDDLSFLLYHKGELITEAGNRNYNYSDPKTEYIYTAYAHNVLFVDGGGWPMKQNHLPQMNAAAYQTAIIRSTETEPEKSVSGRQIRIPGVVQERTLRYRPADEIVEVEDCITLNRPANLRLIYHIADGVDVTETEEGYLCARDGVPVARLIPQSDTPFKITLYTGEGEPPYRTWIFQGKTEARFGSVLAVDCNGSAKKNRMMLQVILF